MRVLTDKGDGGDVEQFYGKWPFKRSVSLVRASLGSAGRRKR